MMYMRLCIRIYMQMRRICSRIAPEHMQARKIIGNIWMHVAWPARQKHMRTHGRHRERSRIENW